ncbi:hypothetical protein VTK56DRAFT_918 [Thermocarpiscus australiensis]
MQSRFCGPTIKFPWGAGGVPATSVGVDGLEAAFPPRLDRKAPCSGLCSAGRRPCMLRRIRIRNRSVALHWSSLVIMSKSQLGCYVTTDLGPGTRTYAPILLGSVARGQSEGRSSAMRISDTGGRPLWFFCAVPVSNCVMYVTESTSRARGRQGTACHFYGRELELQSPLSLTDGPSVLCSSRNARLRGVCSGTLGRDRAVLGLPPNRIVFPFCLHLKYTLSCLALAGGRLGGISQGGLGRAGGCKPQAHPSPFGARFSAHQNHSLLQESQAIRDRAAALNLRFASAELLSALRCCLDGV